MPEMYFYKFVGDDSRFTLNQTYSMREILKRSGMSVHLFKNRFGGRYDFDETHLSESRMKPSGWVQFNNAAQKISAEWLRKPLK
tara:strand:- start:371 stop:622 length:252 start_codon:yes stop_codon:yes gene_type:complete